MAITGLSARPYLDQNMDPQLAHDLRAAGFDAVHSQEVGNAHAPDEAQLQWATARGRVVVTFDLKDFRRLAKLWAAEGRVHAGIILAVSPPRLGYGELLRRLLVLLNRRSEDELVNRVEWLDASWADPN